MKVYPLVVALAFLFTLTAAQCENTSANSTASDAATPADPVSLDTEPGDDVEPDTAVFAGGCFWCMEPPYEKLDGVFSVVSGYAGGTTPNPTYREVSSGRTDYEEAVRVVYDPEVIDFETLVQVFWHNIDPLAENRQFCDRGPQYRSVLYYRNAEQQAIAEASLETVRGLFDEPIATTVEPPGTFYEAEDYHQDFYRTNPDRYYSYREGCRRDARLEELWGDKAGKPGPLS